MENNKQEFDLQEKGRLIEIQECRQQIAELQKQAAILSDRLDKMMMSEGNARVDVKTDQKHCQTDTNRTIEKQAFVPPINTNPFKKNNVSFNKTTQVKHIKSASRNATSCNTSMVNHTEDLENKIGKNIFAILASLLVLIGVGIFISTFYEMIPDIVKIGIIYIFGFALLGVGLKIYSKGHNKFWLGLASCGMAELLVSIITSHTYFGVISLPITYALIILWVVGSFALTKYHPIVFKTIGYLGFWASTLLGQSLLTTSDGAIYISLFISFVVLSALFMISNKECVKLNTMIAFASTLGLMMFSEMEYYLQDLGFGAICITSIVVLAAFNYLYLFKARLSNRAYPFYSAVSTIALFPFITFFSFETTVPTVLIAMIALWWMNAEVVSKNSARLHYSAFVILIMTILAMEADANTQMWFALCSIAFSAIFSMVRRRDAAWIGFASFLIFVMIVGAGLDVLTIGSTIFAIVMLVITHSRLVEKDSILQLAWYALSVMLLYNNYDSFMWSLYDKGYEYSVAFDIGNGLFWALLAVVNTWYTHFTIKDNGGIARVNLKSVLLMVMQGVIFIHCVESVESSRWPVVILGILSSLMIISYSLIYSIKTKMENQNLMVWQFVKFTLYCWLIMSLLGASNVFVHIVLLLMAISAIVVGFKLLNKSVRVYGLILSIIDVASLALFSIDYDDSLQFAGGVILCGALCFVISFIYSKISKSVDDLSSGTSQLISECDDIENAELNVEN